MGDCKDCKFAFDIQVDGSYHCGTDLRHLMHYPYDGVPKCVDCSIGRAATPDDVAWIKKHISKDAVSWAEAYGEDDDDD